MSNTRYNFTELLSAQAVGTFETGKTVTIQVINAKTGVAETLTQNACSEILSTGVFTWEFSDLDTFPAVFTQYLYIMTDNSATPVQRKEMLDSGGWVESLPGALIPADLCKITVNLSESDGVCAVDINTLMMDNNGNTMEIADKYFANTRYFKVGDKIKPSYDFLAGQAYWIFPQGASVNIDLQTFKVTEKVKTVPSQSEITLNDWLNL